MTRSLPPTRRLWLLGLALAAVSGAATAHGPTRQKVTETITINAPAATVWARIKDFAALQAWHPAVASSPADKGNEVGSVRQLTLKGGGALTETLEAWDDAGMKYTYRAKDGGALPVTNYTSTLRVTEDGGKATVEWRGAFYRGYPNNNPPPDQNDEAAVRAVTGVYQSGLANLKSLVEGK
ncbi:SRPBCC family protein [Ideonella sp. 4Y16]|uniref:SRPBCC family protein n=1 Tax=Ideonella alba TaxID=2824118 RepID=A0A940Y9L3_9BURK|nr:SRPBCC family protein [Ideonella alba]MBQ0930700.1 SRPBCC family protein [Ideonella alba]MBQ0944815.1 SRPBCC family protein [Ideonella alba]